MLAAYPEARLIQTHRDPLKTTASLSSLVTHLRVMSSDRVDPVAIGRQWARWNADALNRSVAARRSGLIAADQIHDLSFYEFMHDPMGQIETLYRFVGFDLSPTARRRMEEYLRAKTADEHGAHRYRFEDFGLDVEEERERVRDYLEYFDVPREPL